MNQDINIELLNHIRSCSNIIKRSKQSIEYLPQGYGRIMSEIYHHNGLTQSELAEKMDIRPQSLTRSLSELEEKELIERKRSKEDRRIISVYITDQGIKKHKEFEELRKKRADVIFACLDEKQKQDLLSSLNMIIDHYNHIEKDQSK